MSNSEHFDKLEELINLMMSAKPFTENQLRALWKKDKDRESKAIEKMLSEGITYGEATGGHDFLNQPEEDFRKYLKSIDNELGQQVEIVLRDFKLYLERGEAPAPYYPWRIAIILRKNKLLEKEKEFLTAWYRHFSRLGSSCGARYRDLNVRAEKMGIEAI